MKSMSTTLRALTCALFIMALSCLAQAQATRTWVSGVGDDVNPCSRTAPCKTYAGAITKTARDGEISTLDPGGFGAVTITKSITINGGNGGQGYGSILAALTTGVVINITDAADVRKTVRLDWLNINGASTGIDGIRMSAGNALHIENCLIDGFTDDGITMELNSATVGELYVRNTTVRNVGGDGIQAQNLAGGGLILASIDNVHLANSGNGVRASNNSRVHIREAQIATMNAGGSGVLVAVATGEANVDRSLLTNCPDGLRVTAGTARISNSFATGNTNGLNNVGGTLIRFNNNMVDGNSNNTVGVITPASEG
jgi:hypothetical protein